RPCEQSILCSVVITSFSSLSKCLHCRPRFLRRRRAAPGLGTRELEKIADRSGFRDARGNRRPFTFWRSWFQHSRKDLGASDRRDQRNGERLSRTRNKNSPAESRHGEADVSFGPEPKRRRDYRSC